MCCKRDNNRSLLEECTLAHLNSLQDPVLKLCLLEEVDACPKVVAILRENGFPSAESTRTGRTARVHGRSIQQGDICLYYDDDRCENTDIVGEIFFLFARVGGELVAGLSEWPLKEDLGRYRKVIMDDHFPSSRLHSCCMPWFIHQRPRARSQPSSCP